MISEKYLEQVRARRRSLEDELSVAAGADPAGYRKLVGDLKYLQNRETQAARYLELVRQAAQSRELAESETDPDLKALAAAEVAELETEIPEVEKRLLVSLLPPSPDDNRNVILEIRAGTGGEEAALFAGDLYRMYKRYAEVRGWTCEALDASPSDLGGFKDIAVAIEGERVYARLRFESGGHRVQRVPQTEASGRIHTSAATVAVLMEADEMDKIEIRTADLRVDTYRASGAGGQHVNKTDSAVRITHLPSGVVVQCQEERSQQKNRAKCMKMLMAKLLDRQRQEQADKDADTRRTLIGSGDRSERIRTYNFPQNRLTDHRINLSLYSLDRVMEGHLDDVIDALISHHVREQLKDELEEG